MHTIDNVQLDVACDTVNKDTTGGLTLLDVDLGLCGRLLLEGGLVLLGQLEVVLHLLGHHGRPLSSLLLR